MCLSYINQTSEKRYLNPETFCYGRAPPPNLVHRIGYSQWQPAPSSDAFRGDRKIQMPLLQKLLRKEQFSLGHAQNILLRTETDIYIYTRICLLECLTLKTSPPYKTFHALL
ncbi:hypothetical protein XENTR_v10003553 [Xenopus tropicalis]|nr:hypothetical protein XENTR_v10003553 [Xenopus tropicalis]